MSQDYKIKDGSEVSERVPMPLILDGITYKVAGKAILSNIDCCLEARPRSFIIGPNGAGKSVLLRLCHGLLKPTEGRIIWATEVQRSRDHAMVFQRPVLLRRSVRANIEYALSLQGYHAFEKKHRAINALQETGLLNLAKQPARALSLGEQQLLSLARVWSLQPGVLFLDEPTAHLDPSSTRKVEEIIAKIEHRGTKIIMTSHDMGQVKRMADEVLFLNKGHLIERSSSDRFFSEPRTKEGRLFVDGNLLW